MIDFARLSVKERTIFFDETANRRGLSRLIVEKDFWVCFTLGMIFGLPELAENFVFKGGTSLSKVFNVIKRFSEDIDLSISPDWLGFSGNASPERATSRSQREKRCKRLERACIQAVRDIVCPALSKAISTAIGRAGTQPPPLVFEIDEQTNSPVLIFHYPTDLRNPQSSIVPQVKLELGSLTDQRPIGTHPVKPWVAEEFPEAFRVPGCEVLVLEAERTFWEKVTILHAEYHRLADRSMRIRLSRDCYDVVCMAEHETGKRALADPALLDRVAKHKETYFPSSWAHYETARPGSLRLVPPDSRMTELKRDYLAMREMFFENPPDFQDLIARLSTVEKSINAMEPVSHSRGAPRDSRRS